MKYFKIKIGYGESDYIPIDETEIESAFQVFITESKGIFKNGVVRGKDIISIVEDWHRVMGWNQSYKMGAEDYAELSQKGIDREYRDFLAKKSEKVKYLLSNNQAELIGKNVPELELLTNKPLMIK